MKKYILLSVIFVLTFSILNAAEWNIAKGTHFLVYYKNAPQNFIDQVMQNAENYYNIIADDLGFRRYDFWLWDNRAKIYIHDDAKAYQLATGQPAWSSGCAYAKGKIIHSFPYAQGFSETILPHEMGHIIFREFVGFNNPAIPIWLDEGVASYQEKTRRMGASRMLREAMNQGRFINFDALWTFNPHFTTDTAAVTLFYAESVNIVDYLIGKYGKDSFVLFCQNLKEKSNFDRALSSAYPFKNKQELGIAWQDYLKGK